MDRLIIFCLNGLLMLFKKLSLEYFTKVEVLSSFFIWQFKKKRRLYPYKRGLLSSDNFLKVLVMF